jgi:hypothetical protein
MGEKILVRSKFRRSRPKHWGESAILSSRRLFLALSLASSCGARLDLRTADNPEVRKGLRPAPTIVHLRRGNALGIVIMSALAGRRQSFEPGPAPEFELLAGGELVGSCMGYRLRQTRRAGSKGGGFFIAQHLEPEVERLPGRIIAWPQVGATDLDFHGAGSWSAGPPRTLAANARHNPRRSEGRIRITATACPAINTRQRRADYTKRKFRVLTPIASKSELLRAGSKAIYREEGGCIQSPRESFSIG